MRSGQGGSARVQSGGVARDTTGCGTYKLRMKQYIIPQGGRVIVLINKLVPSSGTSQSSEAEDGETFLGKQCGIPLCTEMCCVIVTTGAFVPCWVCRGPRDLMQLVGLQIRTAKGGSSKGEDPLAALFV